MAWQSHQQQFYDFFFPYAQQASVRTGLSPNLIFAQAALESNWGRSAPGNNYFGIKGAGGTQTTQEYINGKWVTIKDSFRRYASPLESILDWGNFLGKYKRYKPVLNAQGAEAQARALGASGYATDPNYGKKLLSIMAGIPQGAGPDMAATSSGIDWGSPYSVGESLGDWMRSLGVGLPDFDGASIGSITGLPVLDVNEDSAGSMIDEIMGKLSEPLKRVGFVVVALVIIGAALFLMAGKQTVVVQGN